MEIELGEAVYTEQDGPEYFGIVYRFNRDGTAEVHFADPPPRLVRPFGRRKTMFIPRDKENIPFNKLISMRDIRAVEKKEREEEKARKRESKKLDERLKPGKSIKNKETGAVYTFGQRGRRPEWVMDYVAKIEKENK